MQRTITSDFYQVFEHQFRTVGELRIHYVDGGPRDGELIVLLHGWPQTWYAWRKVMPGLSAAGYRVVAVDYRGAGDSERPVGGYDKTSMAADIAGLIEQLGAKRAHLVGRDIGVMVAYALAARHPDLVASLTMIDVPVPATKAWYVAKDDPQTWHFGFHQQRDIAEMLVAGREYEYLSTFYRARIRVAGAVTDEDLAVYAATYAAPGAMRAGFELYRAFPRDEEQFAQYVRTPLPMPVLAMGGELDNGEVIGSMAREVAENVTAHIAPGGGHWTPEESPEFVVTHLVNFLRQ